MKPIIERTTFGSITISGKTFDYDVVIRMNGEVVKRKKKLSKARYGTSHKISPEEAEYIFEKGVKQLIIGTGQTGYVVLSDGAAAFFRQNDCLVQLLPTPRAAAA